MKKYTIATRLGIRFGFAVALMFAAFGALAVVLYLLGEPKWLAVSIIPLGFLIPIGSLILIHTIVVCPYCQTFDPVGWMTADGIPIRWRKACPTCHARMDEPFDPRNQKSALRHE